MSALDLDLLRTYVAIVDDGGFGRAARRLNCTQSTASLHVRRLEEATGTRLLDRGPRRLAVTRAGETLLGYARRLLALHDEAQAELARPQLAGSVVIGVSEDFPSRQLPQLLRQFTESHPQVTLEVRGGLSRALLDALERRELDLLIGRHEAGRPLWTDPLVWVDAVDAPRRAEPLPLVLFPEGCIYREQALKRLKRPWRIVYTSNSLTAVQAAVAAGLGLSVLAKSALAAGLKVAGGLPRLPLSAIALHRAPRLSPAATALAQAIEARFAA